MDTLTHGFLGAVIAQTGFRDRIGRDAPWFAAATAVAADADVFVKPLMKLAGMQVNDLTMMHYHRGLSHSLLMVPVIAVAVAGLWWSIRRKWASRRAGTERNEAENPPDKNQPGKNRSVPPFRLLLACCFIAALTHPLLDWCTSYGTQILSPITTTRYAIDAIPIVDIFYTPILILTLLTCRLVRWFKTNPARTAIIVGITGFALSTGYIITGAAISLSLRAQAEKILNADETRAYPMMGTIFLWRITARDGDTWYVGGHNVLFSAPLEKGRFTHIGNADNEWTGRARGLEEVKTYEWFAMGQIRASYRLQDGRHVVGFHDMRYGLSAGDVESMWPMVVTFDETGKVLDISRRHSHRHTNMSELFRRIWRETWKK